MTTLTRRGARSGEQPPADPGDHRDDDHGPGGPHSAWGRFTGSWGIALRMARRDVRRHRGRSALIVLMVALPTLLLVFAIVAGATSQVDGPEQIPQRMGNGVAMLEYPQPGAVTHTFDPRQGSTSDGTGATPVPGWVDQGSAFVNAEAVGALTRTTAVPFLEESVATRIGDRRVNLEALAIDPRPGLKEKVELTSGRLPERRGEMLVTDGGEARGLPTSGRLTMLTRGDEVEVEVVGTARASISWGGSFDVVVPEPFVTDTAGGGWVLLGSEPVTWSEVTRLNAYGFTVWSADVLRNPPPVSVLSRDQQVMLQNSGDRASTFVAIGGALLLIITTLLVGPAFAVSAARQRRTLALSASNGATTSQLRHTVLASALVLGVIAAVAGSGLGVAVTWVLLRTSSVALFLGMSGPFDVPLLAVGLVTLAAVASAVIAALLPARRLGRLDIVGVMKGQSVSPRPSRLVFLLGAVLAGVGGFAVIGLAATQAAGGQDGGEVATVAATVALVVGAIMLAPMILVGIARLSSRLPVPLRMATRDAGRQRSRSVPAIAAILAGVAVLTMTLIASGSDNEQGRREYTAQNVPGDARALSNLPEGGIDARAVSAAFTTVRPGLEVSTISSLDTGDPWRTSNAGPTKPYDLRALNVVPPGCSPDRTVTDIEWTPSDPQAQPPCQRIGTHGMGNVAGIGFTTTAEITRRLALLGREADARVVEDGGVVVGRAPGSPSLLVDGRITLMSATQTVDPNDVVTGAEDTPPGLRDVRTVTVPAVEVELAKDTVGTLLAHGMLAPTELATTQGWPTVVDQLNLHDPAGPVSQDLLERLAATTGDEVWLETERGYQSPLKWIVLVLIGIFTLLLLVITLTSTALTLAEQENDQATLAALGSGRGTRRVMAAAQAFTLCIIGAVLGIAVGIVPGIALAYPLTGQSWNPLTGQQVDSDPVLVFPWLVLAGFAVAVPAVAAGLAAAGIRRAPDATRRTA